MLHANMVYARYQRAAVVFFAAPATLCKEVADPTRIHAAVVLATVFGMVPLAGWLHREATRWWATGTLPQEHQGPTPPLPPY